MKKQGTRKGGYKPTYSCLLSFALKKGGEGEFPGSPVVKTLSSQCRGHRFDPRWGNQDAAYHVERPNNSQPYLMEEAIFSAYTVFYHSYLKAYFCKCPHELTAQLRQMRELKSNP